VKDKGCSFSFEVHVEMTDFGRRKENHITTSKLEPDTWFQEANIASFTVIVRYSHNNAKLLVVDISVDSCGNVKIDNKPTEWICRGKTITRKNISILSDDSVFLRKYFLKL
jgi:hypothetical protein